MDDARELNAGAAAPATFTTALPAAVDAGHPSLEGLHATVAVPKSSAGFWRQYRAFAGPALLVSVGYMDPGNWATDLQGGAKFKYGLLWVVALSSLMAIVLQICSARLGVVTGKDLAQACRDYYPRWTRWPNYLTCELAIMACDLAEVLGSAVAIKLLFGIPLLWAVLITASISEIFGNIRWMATALPSTSARSHAMIASSQPSQLGQRVHLG